MVSLRFPKSYFQHAILLVGDNNADDMYTADGDKNYNVSVYIGDDANYENNQECPGGPFLPYNNDQSFFFAPSIS